MAIEEFRELLNKGVAAHQAGQIEDALTAYRAAIGLQPDDAEASSLMGLALSASAWSDQAIGFLARAVRLEPEQIPFRLNLVEGLERLGQLEQARQEVRAIVVRDSGQVRAWEKAGDLAAKLGDLGDAQSSWSQAQMLAPDQPAPALKLAQLAALQGDLARSHQILDSLAQRLPTDARVISIRCDLFAAERNWPQFAAAVEQWLSVAPNDASAWRALSRLHFESGRYREAANTYGRVLTLTAPNAADFVALASLSLHALDVPAATGALAQAEKLDPENPELLSTRALLSLYLGNFSSAIDDCMRCLAKDATNVSATVTLSRARRGHLADRELSIMRLIATDQRAHLDNRIPAAFVVAHALDAGGKHTEAFAAYGATHSLAQQRDQMESRKFDAAALELRKTRILGAHATTSAFSVDSARDSARPIFIVGMPRSGTTLIEAVLAAHSRVFGCGERRAMPPVVETLLAKCAANQPIDEHFAANARRSYFAGLPSLGAADHFTDKQLFNFEAIGLIDQLFPDAGIVYLRRNPIETCLSIYRQEFDKAWSFVHELKDIAAVYAYHAELMREWQLRLPGRFTTIQYEDFVADFEPAARSLIAACRLEWDPACLEFQRANRPIATFSTVEARDPVASRNGRANNYRAQLQPLVDQLLTLGVDIETGSMRAASAKS